MKQVLFLAMLVGIAGFAVAGDCCSVNSKKLPPTTTCENDCKGVKCTCEVCACSLCKCDRGKYCECGPKCNCDPCECRHEPLSRRVWVEDVYRPGYWYWGYYVKVDNWYEFHYQRSEVRNALSNFDSLVWVNYKHNLRLAGRKPVKVVYVP